MDLSERFVAWVTRDQPVATRSIELHRRRIYILPTRHGYVFAAMVLVMVLGAMNYNNSMAFAFAFTLAGLGANAMWQTHRNLLGLVIDPGVAGPVFAGDEARFDLRVRNPSARERFAVACQWQGHRTSVADVPAQGEAWLSLYLPTRQRGRLRPGRFRVLTRYPLGLFQAWSWPQFDMAATVYPCPAPSAPPLPDTPVSGTATPGEASLDEDQDFDGLRRYQPGDPPRRIAWKTLARSDVLASKRFTGGGHRETWLDWGKLAGRDPEDRLAVLSRWVLDADARGDRYGLCLPGRVLGADRGPAHRHRCLEALALHGLGEQDLP